MDEKQWLVEARTRLADDADLKQVIDGLATYADKERRPYAHFVDGGITDNLGLRAIYEIIEVLGGAQSAFKSLHRKPPTRLVVISAIDNLMKGAAGSAVQCMNLMFGFDECAGLEFPGLYP